MSFMHGAQDGQKFIGVLFLGAAFAHGQNSVSGMEIPVWLMLLCSVVMALGTSVGGEKIIKSVGLDMVKLERYQGFAADVSGALCLLYSSLFGICLLYTSPGDAGRGGRDPSRGVHEPGAFKAHLPYGLPGDRQRGGTGKLFGGRIF